MKVKQKVNALCHLHSNGGPLLSEDVDFSFNAFFRTLLSVPIAYSSLIAASKMHLYQ